MGRGQPGAMCVTRTTMMMMSLFRSKRLALGPAGLQLDTLPTDISANVVAMGEVSGSSSSLSRSSPVSCRSAGLGEGGWVSIWATMNVSH